MTGCAATEKRCPGGAPADAPGKRGPDLPAAWMLVSGPVRGLACLLAGRREEAEQAFTAIPQDCAAADMARAIMEVA